MLIMKIVKANLISQLIWLMIMAVGLFLFGLFSTKNETKKKKFTKDGFQSDEMQSVYDHYLNKEMQYGKSKQ